MRRALVYILLITCAVGAGCGARLVAPGDGSPEAGLSRADWTLDQIEPRPEFPPARATTRPADAEPAPLDAIELFARARSAMHSDYPHTAVSLLERALELDPESFELHYALGQARLLPGAERQDEALRAFRAAAALRPRDLDVQMQLGRIHMMQEDLDEAIDHLRLAMQTEGYERRPDAAAVVDLLLGTVLEEAGYDRAALERFNVLLVRTEVPSLSMQSRPELAPLLARRDLLLVQIAQIHQRRGEHREALRMFERAAALEPGNFELQEQVVRTLLAVGRRDEARRRAAELVVRFRAGAESLELLREVYRELGREKDMADELLELYGQRSMDHSILFAAVDVLQREEDDDRAEQLLRRAVRETRGDVEVVRRLFSIYEQGNEVEAAARLLIEALAMRPAALRELGGLWESLLQPSRRGALRVANLQRIEVSAEAQAAKLFWLSRIAEMWQRDALAQSSLQHAVELDPPFAPAYRALLGQIWSRQDWQQQDQAEASEELAESAERGGDAALAAELRGLSHLQQGEAAESVEAFAEARRLGGSSPDLYVAMATALQMVDQHGRSEQMLWTLISDYPLFEDAYAALFNLYLQGANVEQAMRVLSLWRSADPQNVNARLLQAGVLVQMRRGDAAERLVRGLFDERPDDPQVIQAMYVMHVQAGRLDEYITLLEAQRREHPENRAAIERLIGIYAEHGRMADALRVLDETRRAVSDDPDLLYYVGHLYMRVGRQETMEQTLEAVVELDPTHAPASNDLGYTWADEGRNLERAEELIRVAVEAEPDNQSFLDSLGWVLYKRGKFAEALEYFERAVGPATRPDPVVLDHLGDVYYRLQQREEAEAQWRRALQRLDETPLVREDLVELRGVVEKKLVELKDGGEVEVAPLAGE